MTRALLDLRSSRSVYTPATGVQRPEAVRLRVLLLCDLLAELGLLATVLAVPLYFNIDDARIFEPDKATLLRDAAALLSCLGLLRLLLHALGGERRRRPRLLSVLPLLLFPAVTLLATTTSILPWVSLYGSYARAQGALTTLAYLTLALLAMTLHPAQIRRLVAAMALSGTAPAAYGWLQRFGHDPLPWQQPDLAARVPGSLGNPIFLGALLAMTLPLTLAHLVWALQPNTSPAAWPDGTAKPGRRAPRGSPNKRPTVPPPGANIPPPAAFGLPLLRGATGRHLRVPGWLLVALIQAGGLLFTNSRGPAAGLLFALLVLGLTLSSAYSWPLLCRLTLALALPCATVLLALNLLAPALLSHLPENGPGRLLRWSPLASGTSEVRLILWGPALQLVVGHPLLGCGPDTLMACYYPVYPTALRHLEAPNAVPDRTHDIYLDVAAETGLLGLAAFLLLLGATVQRLLLALRRGGSAERGLAAALLAALAGHLAEGAFGIAVMATALLTWLIAGLATSLAAQPTPHGEGHVPSTPTVTRPASASRTDRLAPDAGRPVPRWPAAGGILQVLLRATALPAASRNRRRPRPVVAALLLVVLAGGCVATGRVLSLGARQTAADVAARQGTDLETVALGNSGQAPLPPGRSVQPILALRQFAAADSDLQHATALAPEQEEYWLDRGRTLVEWAQAAAQVGGPAAQQAGALYARALLAFGQAARLNPLDPDPLRDTGKAYERWAGLGQDPDKPQSWDAGRLQSAAQAFARAAALAPHHPDPLASGSQVALWEGQVLQALDLARHAVAMDPQMGDGYRARAEAEIAQGQREAALADWRQALRDPNLGQRGTDAAHLALAEATWAGARCRAVADAQEALSAGGLTPHDAQYMREIVHLAPPNCAALRGA
jgi:hypothetical protein